ncbi:MULTISPECIES: hypothetical protein [Streptomyces]|uniref:Uncharacterized protein n=2 Tax=Streptomyces TaxID=1883 RepID=A0A2N8PHA3_STRNR|nr:MULTISPECIES: hypothetical protein [Streptomyces]PNE40435.1 hypothetical protein AOB60_05700 [Streptomyces noursei]SHM90379.1 hypothetical protein SAMN05216268_11613 [Streptomyces yunnanensis]
MLASDLDEHGDTMDNVLTVLLGYPRGHSSRQRQYIDATPEWTTWALGHVRWRGDDAFNATGQGSVNRLG